MTDYAASSSSPSPSSPSPLMPSTLPAGDVLLRGGAALPLQKITDRFSLRLQPFADLERLMQSLNAQLVQQLPSLQLVELAVSADRLETTLQAARQRESVAFASHVYQMQDDNPDARVYLSDRITLQFDPDTEAEVMQAITAAAGLQILKLVPSLPKTFVFQLTPAATCNPLKLSQLLMQQSAVLLAEPDVAVALQTRSGEPAVQTALQSLLEPTWQITRGERSICVAVAATGFDLNHPGLQGLGKLVAPAHFRGTDTPSQAGTAIALLSVSEQREEPGIAPGCAWMPIELPDVIDDQSIEQLLEWAVSQHADVICCDWAAALSRYPLSLRQRVALTQAATQGRSGKGCVIVFAANPAGSATGSRRDRDLNGLVLHPDVVATAAAGDPASADGWLSVVTPPCQSPCAWVAGASALMLSVNPDLTASDVKMLLQDTADRIPSDYDACGYSDRVGYGQVNIDRAVQAAQRLTVHSAPAHWAEWLNPQLMQIPDADGQGVFSAIPVQETGSVLEIEVSVELEHRYLGDLELYLIAPDRSAILLQSRTLGRSLTLKTTYSFETTPALRQLRGQSALGTWQLHLIDRIPKHTGRLKQWKLRLGLEAASASLG